MGANRFQGLYRLLSNEEIKPGHFTSRIEAPEIARAALPGQFLHVLVSPEPAPLLRRPISISRVDREAGWVEFIYRVVGEGTAILARTRAGAKLDVMGPLGMPFRPAAEGAHIMVGGGVGIPPMLFLADWLLRHPERSELASGVEGRERSELASGVEGHERNEERAESKDAHVPSFDSAPLVPRSAALRMPPETNPPDVTVLLGGRTAGLVLCEDDFAALGVPPQISTDDGSLGRRGLVTDLLREALSDGAPATVYACGPVAMLRAVARMTREFSRPCQVSFEARMGCGVGACLSCVIPTSNGYQRVCTEGPAFDAETVDWEANLDVC